MTPAAPISVVLTFFQKVKKGKDGAAEREIPFSPPGKSIPFSPPRFFDFETFRF